MTSVLLATLAPLPIVGAHFRPPAKAIMQWLPAGAPLFLVPEPTNQFDDHAIAVYIETIQLCPSRGQVDQELLEACEGFGYGAAELLAQDRWHLGYVARDQVFLTEEATAKLGFDMKGKPVALAWKISGQDSIAISFKYIGAL